MAGEGLTPGEWERERERRLRAQGPVPSQDLLLRSINSNLMDMNRYLDRIARALEEIAGRGY